METTSKFKTRLGLFVAAGLVLFVATIFYIGRQKHLFNPVFRINSMFKNINGLQIGNNVRFSGINVGTVDNIQILNDTTVEVSLIVDKDVQKFIKTDCYVTIGSEGLIGDKIINITQGSAVTVVNEGQFLPSNEPLETDAILASLKVTGENAEVVSDQLAQILYKINSGKGTFGMLINDSSMATDINSTITNLKRSTKGLDENMEAAKHNILLRGYFKNKKKNQEDKSDNKTQDTNKKNDSGLLKKIFNKKDKKNDTIK
ncbi:MAG TPA: MlaD family protein [Bacteroidia bacterium]|jgi:phospholipid/cholesterol/gamma-HCH transport system substrate-binding protein